MAGNSEETAPLISVESLTQDGATASGTGPQPPRTRADTEAETNAVEDAATRRERVDDWIGAGLAVGSILSIWIFTLVLILRSDPGSLHLFAFHPPAQTLALVFFTSGILTLQPTRLPQQKKLGLRWHQIIQLGLGFPVILFGSISMFITKVQHHAPHFTSWHGLFGLVGLIWLVLHILVGVATVWFPVEAFGSIDNGKALWKWHRLSGYLLLVWFLVTVNLAGGYATWVVEQTSYAQRFWIYGILPITTLVGIGLRIRIWKLPGFQRPHSSVAVVS